MLLLHSLGIFVLAFFILICLANIIGEFLLSEGFRLSGGKIAVISGIIAGLYFFIQKDKKNRLPPDPEAKK
jgi:uncharacterized membrane protein YadS